VRTVPTIARSRRESLARKKNKQAQKDKKALKDMAQEAKKPKNAASGLDSPAADPELAEELRAVGIRVDLNDSH
jgi:hypothetical protein